MVNGEKFTVVERRDLSRLQEELDFQLSGMVSDETIQGIGKLWGARFIISGSFEPLGDRYRLSVKALEVETGRIAAQDAFDVHPDSRLNSLLSGTGAKKITRFSVWLNSWRHCLRQQRFARFITKQRGREW
jgi:TolB-like protein